MPKKKFRLYAKVSSNNPSAIRPVLTRILGSKGKIASTEDGFEINAELQGENVKDLNRELLSEMRRIEKRTRLRAEWSYGNTTRKFFDYVPKGIRREND